MWVIKNSILPMKGFAAINLFNVLFVRKECRLSSRMLRHEMIHTAQMVEMLFVGFYLWYVVEWLIRLLFCKGNAYRNLSFEREAYANDGDVVYLRKRKMWAFLRYIRAKKE